MAAGGQRYRLVFYHMLLDRWWRTALAIGLVLLALFAALKTLPRLAPDLRLARLDPAQLLVLLLAGITALAIALLLALLRRMAYVQPFPDRLWIVTPFLRLSISYRRIRMTGSSELGRVFGGRAWRGWKRKTIGRLANATLVLLELTGWPMPPRILRLFLSPFFFPDRSPRLAILVSDWMAFSSELESLRGTWQGSRRPSVTDSRAGDLLDSLREQP